MADEKTIDQPIAKPEPHEPEQKKPDDAPQDKPADK